MQLRYIIIVLLVLFADLCFSQHSIVTEEVAASFKERFYAVKDAEWQQVGDTFKCDFWQSERAMIALFSNNGNWLKTITILEDEDVSEALKLKFIKNKESAEIVSIERIETISGVVFQVSLKTGEKLEKIVFDALK